MKSVLFVFITLFFQFSYTQKLETKLVNTYNLDADIFVGIDDIGNIYYIKDNTLFKKSKMEILNYSNVSLGNISMVDIRNPFKILVFYKNFNSLVILDTKLNELSNKIDFTKETLFNNVKFISHSSENNLWLFADDNKLHLFDYLNYTDQIQTQPISFYRDNFSPISLKSNYKNAWILGNSGVIQINEYGNFINFIEMEEVDFILSFKKGIIYVKNSEFGYIKENESFQFLIKNKHQIKDIHVNNSSLSIFDGSKVYQYYILII